jgi:hypothetical protein
MQIDVAENVLAPWDADDDRQAESRSNVKPLRAGDFRRRLKSRRAPLPIARHAFSSDAKPQPLDLSGTRETLRNSLNMIDDSSVGSITFLSIDDIAAISHNRGLP